MIVQSGRLHHINDEANAPWKKYRGSFLQELLSTKLKIFYTRIREFDNVLALNVHPEKREVAELEREKEPLHLSSRVRKLQMRGRSAGNALSRLAPSPLPKPEGAADVFQVLWRVPITDPVVA